MNQESVCKKALRPMCFFIAAYIISRYGPEWIAGVTGSFHVITPDQVNFFASGATLILALYSLSLFLQKRSEQYLLWLCFISVMAFVKTLLASELFAGEPLTEIKLPLDILTVVICFALCFWLTGSSLPGKFGFLLSPKGIVLMYGFLLLLRYTIAGSPIQILMANMPYFAGWICLARACVEKKPCAYALLFGMTARYGMRGYLIGASASNGAVYAFMNASQLDFLVFVFMCWIAINQKFVSKFVESDRLAVELAQMNRNLDKKVLERTAELETANKKIMAQQEQKHNMMLNIFHDLRSPLFVISGYTDMLSTHNEKEELHKSRMRERLDFLNRLIEDLFLIAKLEDNKIRFDCELINVTEKCSAAIEAVGSMAAKKGVSIQFTQRQCRAIGDGFRLLQILQNLLENAINYSHPGGRIMLECSEHGNDVIISVVDNGAGMNSEELSHIFERYYHNRSKQQNDRQSTGLGLAIAQSMVHGIGGTIWAESCEGKGTRVTFTMPIYH